MNRTKKIKFELLLTIMLALGGCVPTQQMKQAQLSKLPETFSKSNDSSNSANTSRKLFYTDEHLLALIDTAIKNNPEVNITLQEIEIASNEVSLRHALLFPSLNAGISLGLEKTPRYTAEGAGNASTSMTPGNPIPEPLGDFSLGFQSNWEADVWHKLRNSKKAAYERYLSSAEGKNFVITNLVAEIANSYYELRSLDNQLSIIKESIDLQHRELDIVKIQKEAAKTTELAVKQFEAQLLKAKSMENEIEQQITENENKINFLLGRYPQKIIRDTTNFISLEPKILQTGLPSQLLGNRPDIRQAEHELAASGLDVKVAKAEFYPSLEFEGALGYRAYKPSLIFSTPESMLFSLAGSFFAPIVNRNSLKAEYNMANLRQQQALYGYQNTILNSYREVSDQMSNIKNLEKVFYYKSAQTDTLRKAIDIAHELFLSARADYLEVLTAQQEALDARLELNETMKKRFNATVDLYKALGGGWN